MYDYIKGKITNKTCILTGNFITLENGGLGYLLEITSRDYDMAEISDENIKFYTVLIHREDKMSLCGFRHKEDRDIFNILMSVSGVGVKMALTLLGKFSAAELAGLVIEGDYKELTLAKGVGPKLAQKIILELKDKLINYQKDFSQKDFVEKIRAENANLVDAQSVLLSFGYDKNEIKSAFAKLGSDFTETSTAENILQETLKVLAE